MTRQEFICHVREIQEPLRRFLTALCLSDSQLADDIAQEAFIKAYLAIDTLVDSSKFKPWIYRIAYNIFLNQSRYRHDLVSYDQAIESTDHNTSDDAFRFQDLYLALNKISNKERMAILLFYMEGYSIKEIAQITKSSTHAVKQHLSRGRKHLQNIYGR